MPYTEDQLMRMPMKYLKQLDIQNVEQEQMVQRVLNTRLRNMPSPVAIHIPTHVTDNLTVETEKVLQARIDKVRSKVKKHISSQGDEGEEVSDPVVPDETTDPIVPEEPEFETQEDHTMKTTTVAFCGHCDAPGPFHKKGCNRPK